MARYPGFLTASIFLACLVTPRRLPAQSTALPGAAIPTDSLTVRQIAALAAESAPEVRATHATLGAAMADSSAASHEGRAAFRLFGGATVAPRGFYDPVITNLGQYELKLGVGVPLLDGGVRARAAERAGADARIAAAGLRAARREAGLSAGTLANRILMLQEAQARFSAAVEWLKRLESLLESGVRAGAHGRSEALRASVERDGATIALISNQSELETAARELALRLGLTSGEPPAIRAPEAREDVEPGVEDSARLVLPSESAAELDADRASLAALRVDLATARARKALTVALAADAGLAGANLTQWVPDELRATNPDASFGDRIKRDLGATVALQFALPLTDPAAAHARIARQGSISAAEFRLEGTRRRLRLEAEDLFARWRLAWRRRNAMEAAVTRSEESLLRLQSLYAGGGASLLELLDARRILDDSLQRVAEARAQVRQARFEAELPR